MSTIQQEQLNRFFEIINQSLLPSELIEQLTITTDNNFAVINTGLADARKIKIPLMRGIIGDYDASTNTPSLTNGVGLAGDTYRVSVAGSRDFGAGSVPLDVNDIILYISGVYINISNLASSVNLQEAYDNSSIKEIQVSDTVDGQLKIADSEFNTNRDIIFEIESYLAASLFNVTRDLITANLDIDASGNNISVAAATLGAHAINKTQFDAAIAAKANLSGGNDFSGNQNITGKSTFGYEETTNLSRPVSMGMSFIASPTDLVTTSVDYHGVDIVGSSLSSNAGTSLMSLYPFESTALWGGTGTIGSVYASYFQTNNNSTGTINLAVGIRLLHQNNNAGITQTYQGIRVEEPSKSSGTINNIYQVYVENPTTGSILNWGIYSLATNNFMQGLTLGSPISPSSSETGLNIYSPTTSNDIAKIRLINTDLSVVENQVLSSIDFFNSDNDGSHISSFIKNIGKEAFGRKGSLSFGVATTNTTDAVEAGNFDENGDFNSLYNINCSGTVKTGGYTVATLPAGSQGSRAYVTDSSVAMASNYGAVVAGAGSNVVPVFYDGTNWRIG